MFKIVAKDQIWEFNQPQVMAILNATTDSFYAKSRTNGIKNALEKVELFIKEGARIIDIGGQSTRPGATILSHQEEAKNVLPIIETIHATYPNILISIDTFNSKVAEQALKMGAHIVNDISCGQFDEHMTNVVADANAGFIGMHISGTVHTMHNVEKRNDIMETLFEYFRLKKEALAKKGIHHWIMDPGFGFGKTIEENFLIVQKLAHLISIDLPILLGVSRKSSIYKTLNITADESLNGTTIVNTIGLLNGASIVRVHDVKEAKQIIDLLPLMNK